MLGSNSLIRMPLPCRCSAAVHRTERACSEPRDQNGFVRFATCRQQWPWRSLHFVDFGRPVTGQFSPKSSRWTGRTEIFDFSNSLSWWSSCYSHFSSMSFDGELETHAWCLMHRPHDSDFLASNLDAEGEEDRLRRMCWQWSRWCYTVTRYFGSINMY